MDSIIFDVDGTMWNSTDIVARAWNQVLKKENTGIQVTASQLSRLFGKILPDIAKGIMPDFSESALLLFSGIAFIRIADSSVFSIYSRFIESSSITT